MIYKVLQFYLLPKMACKVYNKYNNNFILKHAINTLDSVKINLHFCTNCLKLIRQSKMAAKIRHVRSYNKFNLIFNGHTINYITSKYK